MQSLVDGDIRILNSDMAVLSSPEPRDDLPCRVEPAEARLGFDLQYDAGYTVHIPLQGLAGNGNSLRMLFRLTPLDGKDRHFYFVDRYGVPAIDEDAKGEAVLTGRYKLGPGQYQVDWLMRERGEKVCSARWTVNAESQELLDDRAAAREPFTVAAHESEIFLEEPPVRRAATRSQLHVKLLVNFTPTDPSDARLRPHDLQNIVNILRAIAREPQIGSFSLVAFNMQEERVIFQQDRVSRIDFPALGEAVELIEGGRVNYAQLADEESGSRFLADLLGQHLGSDPDEPDAMIIVGPKLMLEKKVDRERLAEHARMSGPIFYLIYNLDPHVHPWRDAISGVLKVYKGLEYTISLPKDLGKAMGDMMRRLTGREQEAPISTAFTVAQE